VEAGATEWIHAETTAARGLAREDGTAGLMTAEGRGAMTAPAVEGEALAANGFAAGLRVQALIQPCVLIKKPGALLGQLGENGRISGL
jgi:hypothetical protein